MSNSNYWAVTPRFIVEYYGAISFRMGPAYAVEKTALEFGITQYIVRQLIQMQRQGGFRCPDTFPPDWSESED